MDFLSFRASTRGITVQGCYIGQCWFSRSPCPPHPRVGETGFSASFFAGGPSWSGSRTLAVASQAPSIPELKEWVSGLQASRMRGDCWKGFLRPCSQTPGGRYKGLASGYNSGAVSHSAGQRAATQSSLCLCLAGLGPAARFPLLVSHLCPWPFVCTPPYSPINPLLPVAYLAARLGHPD